MMAIVFWSTVETVTLRTKCLSYHKIEPRRSSTEGSSSPFSNRMSDMMQRGAQQPSSSDGTFRRGSVDDLVLRQQQLLRQEQYQGRGNSNAMQDFGLPSQQQHMMAAAAGMPSLMEISRAEEILAAAREALTANAGTAGRTGAAGNQFDFSSLIREDPNPRSMFAQPEGRWASAYNPTPLRPPGHQQVNAPIATTGGLANQDLQLLLSKQNPQGLSTLGTAHSGQQQQQSPMMMRQAMMNQMPSENMGVMESLLLRQEEERLLMGKRQREDDLSSPKKLPAYGLHPSQFASQTRLKIVPLQNLANVVPRRFPSNSWKLSWLTTTNDMWHGYRMDDPLSLYSPTSLSI